MAFRTDDLVHQIHLPVLIFHARDDAVVPFQLGEKLYKVLNCINLHATFSQPRSHNFAKHCTDAMYRDRLKL